MNFSYILKNIFNNVSFLNLQYWIHWRKFKNSPARECLLYSIENDSKQNVSSI